MHWSRVGWLLLIAVALAVARERPKRDLPLLKKIASHILGANTKNELPKEENYKFYKIPGFDDILIKAIPKVTIKETVPKTVIVKSVRPSIADVKSYMDTETEHETALQKIANFLKLCIFNDNQDEVQKEVIIPINSHHNTIKYPETETNERYEVKSPGFTEVIKPMYVIPTLSGPHIEAVDVIQRRPVVVDLPPLSVTPGQLNISEVVKSTVPTKYSYKQSSHDGTVTTYESEGNPNVVVTRTATIPVLPPYIKIRIQEAAAIGVSPPRLMQPVPAVPAYPQPVVVHGPRPTPIGVFRSPEAFIPSSLPPFISQSVSARPPPGFEILEKSGYLTGYDVYGPPIVVGGGENRFFFGVPIPLPPGYSPIIEISEPKINTNGIVNVTISKTHKGKTNTNHDMHDDKTSSNNLTSQSKDNNNYQDHNTAEYNKGITASPTITSSRNSFPGSKHVTNAVGSEFQQNAIGKTNDVIVNGSVISKYSYNIINHNNAFPTTVAEVGDKAKFDANMQNKKIYIHTNSDSIPNNYLYVPSSSGNNGHSPVNNRAKSGENLYKYQDTTSNTKTDDCLKSDEYAKLIDQLTTKSSNYLNRNPIVVPDDETFVYRQKNADGSSISIKGNAQNTVSVHVEESKNYSNQDGNGSNIPGAEF